MLYLHIKRNKIFMFTDGDEHLRITSQIGFTQVPDWVAKTTTYKTGIKDQSIIDLTPPAAVVSTKPAHVSDPPVKPAASEPAKPADDESKSNEASKTAVPAPKVPQGIVGGASAKQGGK